MKRPHIITIIGTLLLLLGLALSVVPGAVIAVLIAQQFDMLNAEMAAELAAVEFPDLLVLVSSLAVGVFVVVSSTGLLRLRPWGWLMAMIGQGMIMIVNLVVYARGNATLLTYGGMVFSVVIVLYLNQRTVKDVFAVAEYQDHQDQPAPESERPSEEEPYSPMTHLEVREADRGDHIAR